MSQDNVGVHSLIEDGIETEGGVRAASCRIGEESAHAHRLILSFRNISSEIPRLIKI
jgi:hypothetical protein